VNHDRVALSGVRKKGLQLGPIRIFPGGFVREDSVDVEVLELAVRVLIITADPNISDALTFAHVKLRLVSGKV
jgi:hypothetical protein